RIHGKRVTGSCPTQYATSDDIWLRNVHRLAAGLGGQGHHYKGRHAVGQEAHGAVAEGEVGPTRMEAPVVVIVAKVVHVTGTEMISRRAAGRLERAAVGRIIRRRSDKRIARVV